MEHVPLDWTKPWWEIGIGKTNFISKDLVRKTREFQGNESKGMTIHRLMGLSKDEFDKERFFEKSRKILDESPIEKIMLNPKEYEHTLEFVEYMRGRGYPVYKRRRRGRTLYSVYRKRTQ